MKRTILTLLVMAALSLALFGQPVKKTNKIKEEEVPVAIRIAFVTDFGEIPQDGTWTVNFLVLQEGNKTVARPTAYTYRKGNKDGKIEVRYSPDGKLETAKGLKKLS